MIYKYYGCSGLTSIISEIENPFSINNVFTSGSATLYVPAGTKSMYEATAGWNKLSNIVEMGATAYSDGDTFDIVNAEGYTLTFQVTDAREKTAMLIRNGDWSNETLNGKITIPNEVEGFTVTAINQTVFRECVNLTTVVIPNTVLSIGRKAFDDSGLVSITIPSSVVSLGERVFCDCHNLASIIVEEGNTIYDSRNNCNAIIETATNTLVAGCKTSYIPDGIQQIGEWAFQRVKIEEIVIPEGVTSIMEEAFIECTSLNTITLPSTLLSIGMDAFSECEGSIETITSNITEPFPIDKWTFGQEDSDFEDYFNPIIYNTCTLYVPAGTKSLYEATEGWKLFQNIVEMEEEQAQAIEIDGIYYEIANAGIALKDIQQDVYPFDEEVAAVVASPNKEYNGDVVIPSAITYDGKTYAVALIGEGAFAEYKGEYGYDLRSVVIPNSVVAIAYEAFVESSTLERVEIPNSVTYIGEDAFGDCESLEEIVSHIENPYNLSTDVFRAVPSVATLYVPFGTRSKYEATNGWNVLSNIVEREEIDGIYYEIAKASVALKDIQQDVYSSDAEVAVVMRSPNREYNGDVVLPSTITNNGKTYAVAVIGKGAFDKYKNNQLISVVIPNSVVAIEDYAFTESYSLQRVEIPNSVTSIGEDVFVDCTSLREIVSHIRNPFNLSTNVFKYVPSNATLYVPAGTKSKYEATAGWNQISNIVEMEEEETDISQMDNVIYIADAKAIADDLQTMLVVKMKNNVTAAGFHFDLYLPDGCTFTIDDKGRPNAKLSDKRTDSNIKLTTPKLNSDGSLMIEAHSGNASVISGEDGPILMVPIIVAEGTEVGDNHVIYVKNWGISDELGNTLPQPVNPTVIYRLTVIPNIRGDVNGNNVKFIESSDFVALIRYLMELPHVELNTTATDANGDGIIDIGDLTAISNLKKYGSISRPVNNTTEVKSVIFTTPIEAE